MNRHIRQISFVAVFMVFITFLIAPFAVHAANNVVLWNKLGSDYEVTHSDFGPNGNLHQGSAPIVFAPVQFGSGINVQGVETDPNPSKVTFNVSSDASYSGNKGTMAFWVKPNHDSIESEAD